MKIAPFSESEVRNKIDSMIKKAKSIYSQYRVPGETGREMTDEDTIVDEEAASLVWPNFNVFYTRFKHHPSLGPGSADDTSVALASCEGDASSAARSHNVMEDPEDKMQAGLSSRPITPGSRMCSDRSSRHFVK